MHFYKPQGLTIKLAALLKKIMQISGKMVLSFSLNRIDTFQSYSTVHNSATSERTVCLNRVVTRFLKKQSSQNDEEFSLTPNYSNLRIKYSSQISNLPDDLCSTYIF